jgi:RNA polymerase primary sigma factor
LDETAEEETNATVVEYFDDAIKIYLREIQNTKLLSANEERTLAARIDLGDRKDRDHVIVAKRIRQIEQ